jgi:antitoxin YefM
MDEVYSGHYPLIITRKNGENVVMISLDEFNALQETNYLLASSANAKHLSKSIAQHKAGKLKQVKIS